MTLLYILIASTLVSLGIIPVSAILLTIFKDSYQKLSFLFLSFSLGILLGSAFFDLIPHIIEHLELREASVYLVAGIILFWLIHKIILKRRCSHDGHDHGAAGALLLWGDAVHNITDGVIIASSFHHSFSLGWVVTGTVALHELSHGVSEFAVLLNSGYSRKKAILYYALSSSTTIIAALITHFSLDYLDHFVPYVLLMAAANFIYVSLVELVPNLNQETQFRKIILQFLLVLLALFIAYNL